MLSKPAALTEFISCCVTTGIPQAVSLPGPIASMELPKFQPAPICRENWIAVIPLEVDEELELEELLLDEELELLELEELEELLLEELLLDEDELELELDEELPLIEPAETVKVTRSSLEPSSRLEIRSV